MKHLPVLILAILLFSLPAFSQQRWEKYYGGVRGDQGFSGQQTMDSNYIVMGYTYSFGAGNSDVWLLKCNSLGDTLWTKTCGSWGYDFGWAGQQTRDGGYIIVGITNSFGSGFYDVYLIKTNANGDTLWTRTYGGFYDDWGLSIQQTSDGGYIIAGYTWSYGAGNEDFYLIKTDAGGDTLWTRAYGGGNQDEGRSVQQTQDGGYIITGWTCSLGDSLGDVWLIKTNATGDTLWTKIFGGPYLDRGYAVQQTADGGYFIAGETESYGAGVSDVWLIKTDSLGNVLWSKTHGGFSWDHCTSAQQTRDGGYIITGLTRSFGAGGDDVYLIKTNGSGDTLWTKTYGGADYDWGNFVNQCSDDGYIITGTRRSFGAGYQDVYIIKTDPNGSSGVETAGVRDQGLGVRIKLTPNPFSSFATVPGYEAERFAVYDISGRKVGTYPGSRIGEGLAPGVYFVRGLAPSTTPLRVVKVK